LYGAERVAATGPANPARDSAKPELCRQALASGLPVLGISRGLQVINVALIAAASQATQRPADA